ncbi:MAG TPA: carbohydrate kinase [Azospirillaceae bacterium]|nr:carbohydrate kinase [Azospirillaceae bacterium]
MIVSGGEALIDFLPATTPDGTPAYLPKPGGSPFNIAVTLGRLGAPAGFLGRISTDLFGDQLVAALAASNVDTSLVSRSGQPTTLAFVSLGEEEPRYAFYDAGAADRSWDGDTRPGPEVQALHVGATALSREPAGAAYERLALSLPQETVLSLDPNVRPALVADPAGYRRRITRLVAAAQVVKASVADMAWLDPGKTPEATARAWRMAGASLVVVTRGGEGATAYFGRVGRGLELHVPAVPVAVADTVGAGDAFMGGLLCALYQAGVLDRPRLAELDRDTVETCLRFASHVAARTCGRVGADPPWRAELEA